MQTIAAAMTSPPTTTTAEVIAGMATTAISGDNPPNLNLTADTPPATENDAPTSMDAECSGNAPAEHDNGKENVAEDAEKEQAHLHPAPSEDAPPPSHDGLPRDFEVNNQELQIVEEQAQQNPIRPEDAAIPQLNQDGLPDGFALPDPAQIAGLDALIAMGQMEQLGYHPDMALAQAAGLDMPMLPIPNQDNPWLEHAPYPPDVNRPEDRLVGYAKLVFEDGEFYMNTHSVILGRDPTAHRAAQRREKEEAKRKMEAETPGPRTPVQIKREHYNKSVFSEKSGILREGDDSDEETREKRRMKRKASKKSKSTGSSHELSRRNSLAQQPPKPHVYEAQYPARIKEENAVPVDPATLRPDPNECPLIPLHPSGNAPASAYKSISREHVKIAYNFNKATFEMHIYGRNGAFVNEVYHPQNSVVELKSGNMLQIGQVPLEFVLPDGIIDNGQVQYDDDLAADRRSAGGKEMSFDFEDDKRHGVPEDSSSGPVSINGDRDEDDDEDEEGEDEMEEEHEELDADEDEEAQDMSDQDQDQPGPLGSVEEDEVEQEEEEPQPESIVRSGKKRGPGRPPKNGIMSAREEREQKAALKAAALGNQKGQKAQKSPAQPAPTNTPEKKKVGRPRKHDKPDPTEPEKPKRKYTKRKPKEPKDGEAKQEGSDGEDQATKEKKEKRTKPPRSPSPTFVESELSPEQLQKPQANYVTLIYEALSNSKEGKLGLPQIYRAIQRKYPYFVLKVGTLGWQSSVRHNLSQHHAFEKVERDGKGWMWGIVKGVSIEKEKKRRTPPPPNFNGMHHQPIYQAGQQHYLGGYPPQYVPHPGYMPHQMMHGPPQPGQPGHPQYYMGPPPHMNGHPPPLSNQPPPKPINPGLAAAMIPQLNSGRSYSSPYAPTAAPAQAPPAEPQDSEQPTPNEQKQPPTQGATPENTDQGVQAQPQAQPSRKQSPPSPELQDPTPPTQQSQAYQEPPLLAATQQQSAPPIPNHVPELPQHSQQVLTATETFKERMLQSFKDPQGEEILNSAVNQVLGYTHESSLPGNKYEDGIIKHLRSMLEKLPGCNTTPSISPSNPERVPTPQTNGQQPPQASTNQSDPQASAASTPQPSKMIGADKPAPTVMRPTFSGQGQSRPNVSRPPMGTPGVKRDSGSPARIGSDAQIVGQKRGLEEPEDYKDVKRLNGAGMLPLKT